MFCCCWFLVILNQYNMRPRAWRSAFKPARVGALPSKQGTDQCKRHYSSAAVAALALPFPTSTTEIIKSTVNVPV